MLLVCDSLDIEAVVGRVIQISSSSSDGRNCLHTGCSQERSQEREEGWRPNRREHRQKGIREGCESFEEWARWRVSLCIKVRITMVENGRRKMRAQLAVDITPSSNSDCYISVPHAKNRTLQTPM